MTTHSEVLADLAALRNQLRGLGSEHLALLRLSPWRPFADIAVDWVLVVVCVQAVVALGPWFAPAAIVIIANRQRALGNILHDAGHRNLCRNEQWNDLIARALVAPLLFASLTGYRDAHFRHHLELGTRSGDPDLLPVPDAWPTHWSAGYWRNLLCWTTWKGSLAGHLASPNVSVPAKLFIIGWWVLALVALNQLAGTEFTVAFVLLWLVARATVFHAITTFREMCDHFGLRPAGILSFTRDMVCHGVWRALIHPRNNGYHLTHHLLPAVPYYRLPQAQRLFEQMPAYRDNATVCRSYFTGAEAVTRAWQAGPAR